MTRHSPTKLIAALRLPGAGALLASAGIHLDLYVTGYRAIPTVGPLFLIQTIAALLLGATLVALSSPLLSAAGALLAGGTLAGYLSSRVIGLFGFHEVATTAGLSAGLLDTVAFVALGYSALAASSPTKVTPEARHDPVLAGLGTRASELLASRATAVLLPVLGAAALVLSLIAGLGAAPTPTSSATVPSSSATSVTITINNFSFVPATVTVSPGEQVLVHNEDPVSHTLTSLPGSTPFGKFDTGNIASGQTKSITAPKAPGDYQYFCAIHNFMTGVITVRS